MVIPSQQAPWVLQRQTELILRAIQAMHGSVLLAKVRLWIPTYGMARLSGVWAV
jgi:RNase P/RNase MRP subunit POP5